MEFGGVKRDRTADLYNAIVALYQLSYNPKASHHEGRILCTQLAIVK